MLYYTILYYIIHIIYISNYWNYGYFSASFRSQKKILGDLSTSLPSQPSPAASCRVSARGVAAPQDVFDVTTRCGGENHVAIIKNVVF